MAPEVNAHTEYDHRSDIYSLGIVMYRMFNHNRYPFLPDYPAPFYPNDREEALERRFSGEKIPCPKGIDKNIWAILEKCIAFKPEDRFNDADELLDALSHLKIDWSTLPDPITLEEVPKPKTWKWILLIILLTVFSLFILYLLWIATT